MHSLHAIVLAALVALPSAAFAGARVVEARGTVERLGSDGSIATLQRGAAVRDGDLVRVAEDSHARLLVDDQAVIELGAGAELRLQPPPRDGSTSLRLLAGRLWARVSALVGGNTVEVETNNAVAGVRGTSFFAEVDDVATTFSVEAGAVEVASKQGERALLGASERGRVADGKVERSLIDQTAFEVLRGRIVRAERRGDGLERDAGDRWRTILRRERERQRDGDGVFGDGRVRDAIREAYRQRRDAPLDIDPAQARRIYERLRELRRRAATRG